MFRRALSFLHCVVFLFGMLILAPRSTYALTINELKVLAEQGNAKAQCNLGVVYYDGESVVMDREEALKWFRRSAEQGNLKAQFFVGEYYSQPGVDEYKEALEWYRKAAEQGYAPAQYKLAVYYFVGCAGLPQDANAAVEWLRKAAKQNDINAMFALGFCYDGAIGVDQDYAEAVKWYRKAAAKGDVEAQYQLGRCYACGSGVPQDLSKALKIFRNAAKKGNRQARSDLSMCYREGRGVKEDPAEAAKWRRLAEESENVRILVALRKNTQQGDAKAQYNLAEFYSKGAACPFYRKLYGRGDTFEYAFGRHPGSAYYSKDELINYTEAVKWYSKAAEQGFAPAQYALGKLYLEGKEVPQDLSKAEELLRAAVKEVGKKAQELLDIVLREKSQAPEN